MSTNGAAAGARPRHAPTERSSATEAGVRVDTRMSANGGSSETGGRRAGGCLSSNATRRCLVRGLEAAGRSGVGRAAGERCRRRRCATCTAEWPPAKADDVPWSSAMGQSLAPSPGLILTESGGKAGAGHAAPDNGDIHDALSRGCGRAEGAEDQHCSRISLQNRGSCLCRSGSSCEQGGERKL